MNLDRVKKENLIIFEAISGSHAYGTNLETSDIDIRGIFMQSLDDILTFKGVEQVEDDTNDTIFYELKRFFELIESNNPNILELLNVPVDCIKHKDPIMEFILDNRFKFLSKKCKGSFGGYAIQQIRKAKGLDKKINWESNRITRKTPIDFCYAYFEGKTLPLKLFLENSGLKQEKCGLVALSHFENGYALYYDERNELGYKGIEGEGSNELRLSSVPKEEKPRTNIYYNKDGYSMHCKDYAAYQTWLKERNIHRINLVKEHGKQYDGKNMMHCYRLLNTAIDIANKGEVIVRRPKEELEKLMKIRRGQYEYEDLLKESEEKMIEMNESFDKCKLPQSVDHDWINGLLLSMRNTRYFY